MLFRILRPLVVFITSQFFDEIRITGKPRVRSGPLIVVANHPNVMLDGLLVLYNYKQELWFLAKSTLFAGAVKSKILTFFHFVPIYRKQDAAGLMGKNEESFAAASEKLNKGGSILIFPEGKSLGDRKLNPIKTGAARIAFQAEADANFSLGLQIQALGLTYGDFFRFQSTVTASASTPILVSDYKEDYENDPKEAVRKLTSKIEEHLSESTAQVHDSKYDKLVVKVSKLYRSSGVSGDDLERMRTIASEVERLSENHSSFADSIERRLDQYLHLSASLQLDGSKSLDNDFNRFFLYIAAPFIIAGTLIHLPIFRLVERLVSWASSDKSQLASWQISLAFLLFPAWYIVLSAALAMQVNSLAAFWYMLFLIAACGLLAKNYLHSLALLAFAALWPSRRSPISVLKEMRDDLIQDIERIRALQ